jgi:hypothetical protein
MAVLVSGRIVLGIGAPDSTGTVGTNTTAGQATASREQQQGHTMKQQSTLITACTYMGNSTHQCGQPTLAGKSYCAEHYAMVYKVGSGTRRRKDELIAQKVRLVESLFNDAIEQLEAEGFDCYGTSELKTNQFEADEDQVVEGH